MDLGVTRRQRVADFLAEDIITRVVYFTAAAHRLVKKGGTRMTTTKRIPSRLQYEPYRRNREVRGKREEPTKVRGKGRMIRLVISAMLLVTVIGVKFTAPDVLERYRDKILGLLGEDTDFVSAFSSVGRAIGNSEIVETLNDVYVSVFGSDEVEVEAKEAAAPDRNAVVYDGENTPEGVTMFQQVLGFAYGDPLSGELTSAFGYRDHPVEEKEKFHYGIDIAAETGEIIRAFADGEVTAVGDSSDLGKYLELRHENGYSTLYAHCSKVTASSGQKVKRGDPIAEVGQTGEATGPHLHFALCQDTLYLNPIYYVTV